MLKTPKTSASYLAWATFPFPINPLDSSQDTLLPRRLAFDFTAYPNLAIRNRMSFRVQLDGAACFLYFCKRWVWWKSRPRFERWRRLNKTINVIGTRTQRTVGSARTAIPRAMGRSGCKSTGTGDFRFRSRSTVSIPPEWSACQCFNSPTERNSSENKFQLV